MRLHPRKQHPKALLPALSRPLGRNTKVQAPGGLFEQQLSLELFLLWTHLPLWMGEEARGVGGGGGSGKGGRGGSTCVYLGAVPSSGPRWCTRRRGGEPVRACDLVAWRALLKQPKRGPPSVWGCLTDAENPAKGARFEGLWLLTKRRAGPNWRAAWSVASPVYVVRVAKDKM